MKRALGSLSIIAMVVFSVGALWWWALFGMAPEVGMACAATATASFLACVGIYS